MMRQLKFMPLYAVIGGLFYGLYGCNAGTNLGTSPVSISATTGNTNCGSLNYESMCQIILTYNTGGGKGLSVGYTPQQSTFSSFVNATLFESGVAYCNTYIANNSATSGTCPPIIVQFTSTNGNLSTTFNFNFGGKTSNPIFVGGWNN